jgi:hypothetical protein
MPVRLAEIERLEIGDPDAVTARSNQLAEDVVTVSYSP